MLDTRHKHEKSLLISDFYYLFYIGAVEQLVNLISVMFNSTKVVNWNACSFVEFFDQTKKDRPLHVVCSIRFDAFDKVTVICRT